MKDDLLSLARSEHDTGRRLNLLREYLQAHILRSVQTAGGFAALAFQGGTALRFLHGLRRFSEDLDFALERPQRGYDFRGLVDAAEADLKNAGHAVQAGSRLGKPIHAATFKFPGLLHEVGLSALRAQKLAVRMEVDSAPPGGAVVETRLVTRYFPLAIRCHDLPSCMAGKIHALLSRGHTKGRDLFDLAWYLTHPDRPQPNLVLLRNALSQTRWSGRLPDEASWPGTVARFVRTLAWPKVEKDVLPFLEDPRDRVLLDRALLLAELKRRAPGRRPRTG